MEAITPSGLVAGEVGLAHDLRVLDAEAALARPVGRRRLLEGVQDQAVGAVADGVDGELEAGGVRLAGSGAPAPATGWRRSPLVFGSSA